MHHLGAMHAAGMRPHVFGRHCRAWPLEEWRRFRSLGLAHDGLREVLDIGCLKNESVEVIRWRSTAVSLKSIKPAAQVETIYSGIFQARLGSERPGMTNLHASPIERHHRNFRKLDAVDATHLQRHHFGAVRLVAEHMPLRCHGGAKLRPGEIWGPRIRCRSRRA